MTDAPTSKTCTKCGEDKPLGEFHKASKGYLNRVSQCRDCSKAYYAANLERKLKKAADYRKRHPDRVAKAKANWYEKNKVKVKQYHAELYARERAERIRKAQDRYWADPDRYREWHRNYSRNNRGHLNSACRRRYRENVKFRTREAIRGCLHRTLKMSSRGKRGTTEQLLGYTTEDLICRIEYQFQPGMSWSNHGDWHIDHKIPIARFLDRGETRPHIINALSNLQPMWAEENMRKGARWVG